MRAKLKGKILGIKYNADGEVALDVEAKGKVETPNIAAQTIMWHGALRLKSIITNEMKIGAIITINVSDEEAEEK